MICAKVFSIMASAFKGVAGGRQVAHDSIHFAEVIDISGDVGMFCAEDFFVNGKRVFKGGAGGWQVAHDHAGC